MSTKPDGEVAMVSIAQAVILMTEGMDEVRTLLFRGKKQREKLRR